MGSQRENEAMAGLLRQKLTGEASAGSACLEPETLAAYFEHSLEVSEARACDLHLSRCARCREQLVALARAAEAEETRAGESSPRAAWLLDWRWLTAAAGAMALATIWLVHERGMVAPIKPSANLPTVAMNRAEPKPQASAPAYDAKQAPSQASSRDEALAKESAGLRKAAPVMAKKGLPLPATSESVTVLGPTPPTASPSRRQESDTAANQVATTSGNEQLKQSVLNAQRARAASAGHGVSNQQVQTSQAVMGTAQGQSELSSQRQAKPAQVGGAQYGVGVGAGNGGAPAKAQAKTLAAAAPTSAAEASESPAESNAKASLDAAADKVAKDMKASSAPLRRTDNEGMQLEERSAEKVINTPNPVVKWRITSSGFIEHTDDSGATWNGQQVDASGGLRAGSAPDEKTCWVVGLQGRVFLTKDGQHWRKIVPPASVDLLSVSASDASTATVTTVDGSRFVTRNSGKKWKPEDKADAANPQQQP